jgi:hypothetical protein
MQKISREEAKRRGLLTYFTYKPCRTNGHVAERRVSDGTCVECVYLNRAMNRREVARDYNERIAKREQQLAELNINHRKWVQDFICQSSPDYQLKPLKTDLDNLPDVKDISSWKALQALGKKRKKEIA